MKTRTLIATALITAMTSSLTFAWWDDESSEKKSEHVMAFNEHGKGGKGECASRASHGKRMMMKKTYGSFIQCSGDQNPE